MGDPLAGMIPYDAIGLYEQPKPIFRFKMPRVVPEQKAKFESDELFRRLSRDSEVSAKFVLQWNISVPRLSIELCYMEYSFGIFLDLNDFCPVNFHRQWRDNKLC